MHGQTNAFLQTGQPVISVDNKKKELVEDFKNSEREWQPKSKQIEVSIYDFPDPQICKAIPYSIYDIAQHTG